MIDKRTLSGRETLASIESALGKVRREVERLDADVQRAGAALGDARQAQLAIFSRIARIRVAELQEANLVSALDALDQRVAQLLDARREAQAALAAEIAAVEDKLAALEHERGTRQAAVSAAAEAVDAAEAAAQGRLEADDDYRERLEAADRSDAIADQAEEKAQAAATDRAQKGRPYEVDPVFAYLWSRGYGTPRYRAWPLTRLLDRWAARSVAFDTQRRNYALLTEIPSRLKEHAGRMRQIADHDIEAARELEKRAAEAAGVPAYRRELEAAEARLSEADNAIEAQERHLGTLREQRASYANGEDEHSAQAAALLSEAYRREDIASLHSRAALTRSSEDDTLVEKLGRLEDEIARLEDERLRYRQLHQAQRDRMSALEDVRRRFKRSRYDDLHSMFINAALIAALLDGFVGGSVGADEIWDAIRRQQRFRRIAADPLFGTGRFPRGPFPGPWHRPGRGGGWNFPKGGGFGGGGFRGGGGFGGGGFKTGGGF